MRGVHTAEYARIPATDTVDLTSDEEDDVYMRPPRRHKHKPAHSAKPSLQPGQNKFREKATKPVKRYQLLDEEDALGVLQVSPPDVRVKSACTSRKKVCLVVTCLLLLTGCSVAVWVIPCRWYGCGGGPMSIRQSSVHRDYEVMLPNVVVSTRLVVAPAVYVDSSDVIFGVRDQPDRMGGSEDPAVEAGGGVVVVDSSSGAEIWRQHLYEAPVDLQCGGVDLNSNGIFECLATGSSAMMALINMEARKVAWYLHVHNTTDHPVSLLPPIVINDVTDDAIADLLVAGLIGRHSQPRSQLMIADGTTGMVLAKGDIEHCPVLLSLTPEEGGADVTLECMSSDAGVLARTVSITSLTDKLRTPAMPDSVRVYSGATYSHDADKEGAGSSDEGSGFDGAGSTPFQIELENSGVCPACRGRLTLLGSYGTVLWSTIANRSRLHSVKQFQHRNHSGVVYKLWEYPARQEERAPPGLHQRVRRWEAAPSDPAVPTLTFEEVATVTQTSEGYLFKYWHPGAQPETTLHSTSAQSTAPPDDGSTPEYFVESVYVISPGEDGVLRARRLDSVQVTRFCKRQMCVPAELPDNTPSADIVDVGGDLDLDLVTLTSLYVPDDDIAVIRHKYECTLQTRLRKVQLYGPHWQETVPQVEPEV